MKKSTMNGSTKTVKLPKSTRLVIDADPLQAERAARKLQHVQTNAEQFAKIQPICHFESYQKPSGFGLGFLNFKQEDEKIIEYRFSGEEGFNMHEITLHASVKWMRHMVFAELRFADSGLAELGQVDEHGSQRWLDLIYEKLT